MFFLCLFYFSCTVLHFLFTKFDFFLCVCVKNIWFFRVFFLLCLISFPCINSHSLMCIISVIHFISFYGKSLFCPQYCIFCFSFLLFNLNCILQCSLYNSYPISNFCLQILYCIQNITFFSILFLFCIFYMCIRCSFLSYIVSFFSLFR